MRRYASQRLNTREAHRRDVVSHIAQGTADFTDGNAEVHSEAYAVPADATSPSSWDRTLRGGDQPPVLRHGPFDNTAGHPIDLSRDRDFLDKSPADESADLFHDVIPRSRQSVSWENRETEFDGTAASTRLAYEATMLPLSLQTSEPGIPFKYAKPLPNIKT